MSYYIVSDELYHHGILGQKWGVRRYQNPDGSLTAAGKTRYAKEQRKQIINAFNKLDPKDKETAVKRTDSYKKIRASMQTYNESKSEFLKKYKEKAHAEAVHRYNKNYIAGSNTAMAVYNVVNSSRLNSRIRANADYADAVTRIAAKDSLGELYDLIERK